MITSVSQGRALAGCRAFTSVRPRVAPRIANGSTVTMARSKSFMVDVEVAEDEPEDAAVRRYMKGVFDSKVIEKLRARRTRETKIEEWKRRFRERVEANKKYYKEGVKEPTFAELYSQQDLIPQPFADFYQLRDEQDPEGAYDGVSTPEDIFGTFAGGSYVDNWGAYTQTPADGYNAAPGGNSWQGGYM